MSTTRKVLTIIFSILIIAAFAFVLTWGIINWSKVKDGMAGNGLYTQDDVQKSYEDGYNKALADKDEYDKLINGYRDTITTQNDLISQYTSEATALNNSIKDYQGQIATLNDQKTALETQIDTLNTIKASNETTITELNGQIATLNNQVLSLQANKDENARQIESLNSQIANLQTLNNQLQETNELNTRTINGLNAQIVGLNNQIADLTLQSQNNSAVVNALNVKIAELQKSVSYYEQYLGTLESGEQVVATFEFDGSVYNIQVVNKNSLLTVTEPTSTAYVIFNGWTVDGEPIDLATYRITANTKIVADVTHKYEVNFMVEGENHNSQIVLKDAKVTIPANPTKNGYVFEGWTLDGNNVVNLTTYTVTQNVTFTAKFTKLYSVVFKYEDTTLKTETVKSGNYATAPTASSTAYKVFNGWKVNGIMKDVSEYRITADTVFVADITYKYDVKFMADGKVHNSQIVEKHAKPTVPSNPTKTNYVFVGWSVDGTNTVDVSKYMIVGNTTFTAIFRVDKFTVTFKNGSTTVSTQEVTNGSYATVPTFNTETFKGWTVNGTDIVNISTYKITGNTTFTAKFGTWTLLRDEAYHAYSDGYSGNSTEVYISGLKAGDKVKISVNFMQANIHDTGSNGYWYNSPDGNGCYGWQYYGDTWCAMDEYGNITGGFDFGGGGDAEIKSTSPFTSILGVVEYGVDNTFTITISCKKDGVLTIEWNDAAGFYLEQMTFWDVMVLR
ncbi:MAG: InlB B-repeat-containing protein [Clostridia bacterium]|nr:InlB B-repeat-containing protein [Clostridia bacterium]